MTLHAQGWSSYSYLVSCRWKDAAGTAHMSEGMGVSFGTHYSLVSIGLRDNTRHGGGNVNICVVYLVLLLPIAVSYELGKLLSTLCLMKTQELFLNVHSMILLSYCFRSLVAYREETRRGLDKENESKDLKTARLIHLYTSVTCNVYINRRTTVESG